MEPDDQQTHAANGEAEDAPTPSLDAAIPTDRLIVAGIGASAGGVEALQAFFETVPPDLGIAYVVVTHLAPEHRSHLPEILAARTAMAVAQVNGTIALEPDHVYLIPPDRHLVVAGSEISARPFEEPRGHRTPIDSFFRSYAATHGDGFGILLSGGGSDGTLGLKAVKEAGGLVLVQDPTEAEYESMPRSAIATGLADLVLPVRELAARMPDLVRSKRWLSPPDRLDGDEAALGEVMAFLRERTGHDFSQYKRTTVLRRLGRRMQVHRIREITDYLAYLRQNVEEAQALFQDLLISVTTFFRDAAAFEALAEKVIPRLFEERGDEPIRVWVPGCATGEEAYSLAILLLEEAARREARPVIQVFASDLDEGALATAREGRYPAAVEADVSDEHMERFFEREGDHVRIRRAVRDCVLFATHSLLRDPPFSRLDLVSCRNLLIYLDRDLQRQVFGIVHYALRPGGFLFLGSSETAGDGFFRALDAEHRLFQARERPAAVLPHLPSLLATPRVRVPDVKAPPERPSEAMRHRKTLEDYAPPSALVDASRRVLHLSETAGRFLQHPGGTPTADLAALVRPELQLELRAALHRAFDEGEATLSPPVAVRFDGTARRVHLVVRPRPPREGEAPLALVVFVEGGPIEEVEPTESERAGGATVRRRSEELRQTREQLQATREEADASTEELRATNEELQSINEEYRSTTEELETSKEELQSTNEELETVNNELKRNLDEVSRAASDLQNLIAASDVGTLFLDLDLRLKRFTPRVGGLFNVAESDRGRPITDFTHHLDYPAFADDARAVLRDLVPVEREVRSADGRWFLVRLRPYRTVENKIDGVVATFVDFTARREAEDALRQSEERYRLLVEGVDEYAIFMVDLDGQIASWNTGAEHLFGYPEEQIVGQALSVLFTEGGRAAGAPEDEIHAATREGAVSNERWHVRRDGSRFWTSGVMTALHAPDGTLRGYAKVLRDNTERRQVEETRRVHFQSLFESAPGLYLVLDPETYTIVTASDAYLAAVGVEREAIVGRSVFEVFPDDPDDPEADGTERLRASLARVNATSRADVMDVLRYPIRRDQGSGEFEERWWSVVTSPVFGPEGEIAYLIMRVEDVTPFIRQMQAEDREAEGHRLLERRAEHMEADIVLRAAEIQRANDELHRLNETLEERVAERTAQARALASTLTMAEQEERRRIAQVLHDDLQQLLFGVQMKLTHLADRAEGGEADALAADARQAAAWLGDAIETTRRLTVDISPPVLKGEGLRSALEWLVTQMEEVHGLHVALWAERDLPVPAEAMRVLLFQVVRELLFNVVKHAETERATVTLRDGEDLTIEVSDEGSGFDPAAVAPEPDGGFGLFSVRERLALFGGTMGIEAVPGEGARVTLHVPLAALGGPG